MNSIERLKDIKGLKFYGCILEAYTSNLISTIVMPAKLKYYMNAFSHNLNHELINIIKRPNCFRITILNKENGNYFTFEILENSILDIGPEFVFLFYADLVPILTIER